MVLWVFSNACSSHGSCHMFMLPGGHLGGVVISRFDTAGSPRTQASLNLSWGCSQAQSPKRRKPRSRRPNSTKLLALSLQVLYCLQNPCRSLGRDLNQVKSIKQSNHDWFGM